MATPTLTIVVDQKEFPFKATRGPKGITIEKWGWVNTMDAADALKAAGMPLVGAPYDASTFPGVLFVGPEIESIGGVPLGDGTGGVCKVKLVWQTPASGSLHPNIPGDSYTELDVQTTSQQVNYGIAGDPWEDKPVNNGDGVQVESGQANAVVHAYFDEATAVLNIPRYLAISEPNTLNNASLLLPKLLGTGIRLNMAVGQARYRTFSVDSQNGIVHVAHRFVLAPDHKFRWGIKNAEGQRTGTGIADVYELADHSGLWT